MNQIHRGNHMIEKRCGIDLRGKLFVSIKCNTCKGETNIPISSTKEVQVCGICGEYFGAPFVNYINKLKSREMIETDKFEISLVSVERVE